MFYPYIYISMSPYFLLLFLFLSAHCQLGRCPSPDALSLYSASLTVSQGSVVPLTLGQDIQCYNYTLPTSLPCIPSVAIAVNRFQSEFTNDLFFSIKVVASDRKDLVPFVVRTQWGYTRWTRISFSFLAEATPKLQAGSYQIDTATLSACFSGKEIVAFIPFKDANAGFNSAITFLSGFEISSVKVNSYRSPFEVEVVSNGITAQGVTVVLQSTSATQIHAIFISYLAYSKSIPNIISGSYTYDVYSPTTALSFSLPMDPSGLTASFHGFTSFIIRNALSSFDLQATILSNQFNIRASSSLYYLSYSYFMLVGGPCGQCGGYSINYNGDCLATCPPGAYYNGASCVTCQPGEVWNGRACVNRCSNDQIWDGTQCVCPGGKNWDGSKCIQCNGGQVWMEVSKTCACPQGSNWNGYVCITCTSGQIYNSSTFNCQCPQGSYWNNYACIFCPQGQTWSQGTLSCVCPLGSNWNGRACITCSNGLVWNQMISECGCKPGDVLFSGRCIVVPTCGKGQILDMSNYTCVCASGAQWNGSDCVTCFNGQVWDLFGNSCKCPQSQNWNGYSCVSCPVGQIWSSFLNGCSCPSNQHWNGFSCLSCDGGKSWDDLTNSCACPKGLNWNGTFCISCNGQTHWNGYSCIACQNGQEWSPVSSACQCPTSQQWNGTNCVTPCPPSMVSFNGVCYCPAGTYLKNGQCLSQPSCPSGQSWNGSACNPIQCPPGTSWNGTLCTSIPCFQCPAGTYYDGSRCVTNTTSCPPGTKWNGSTCMASGACPEGTYSNGGECLSLWQLCPAGLVWKNGQCMLQSGGCPSGSYFNGVSCIPFQPCTKGRVWNSTVSQCVCPQGTYWNGDMCLQCHSGQSYQINSGCFCPTGTFLSNSSCSAVRVDQCASIGNSIWNGKACVCNSGYTSIGLDCVCQGLAVSPSFCDRCYSKPNSTWIDSICRCNNGLVDISGKCLQPPPPPSSSPICNVATYFDAQQKQCLPCSSGCLSCISCYQCSSCQPGFYMDYFSSLCVEVCGDGKRFTLPCDDGNNVDGDGCSSDCQIEVGYNCMGGSPNSKDTCSKSLPQALTLVSTGQSHLYGKIVLNVRANYLPLSLIKSASDCSNKCDNVLAVSIISGDKSSTGIKASYIAGTSFSFSIEIQFGREPIGLFKVQVGVNQNLLQKYFSGIDSSKKLEIDVNPAFMARYSQNDQKDVLS